MDLRADGWLLVRTKGSHAQCRHRPSQVCDGPDAPRRFADRHAQSIEKAAGINASSAWMNHFSRIRESHPIAAAVRDDDGACRFVGCVSRPVALKLQQQLYPTAQASAGLLQPAKRELVAGGVSPPHASATLNAAAVRANATALLSRNCRDEDSTRIRALPENRPAT